MLLGWILPETHCIILVILVIKMTPIHVNFKVLKNFAKSAGVGKRLKGSAGPYLDKRPIAIPDSACATEAKALAKALPNPPLTSPFFLSKKNIFLIVLG